MSSLVSASQRGCSGGKDGVQRGLPAAGLQETVPCSAPELRGESLTFDPFPSFRTSEP